MSSFRKSVIFLLVSSSLAMLGACGGSGSSAGAGNQAVSKSFTVSLSSIEISRISNGDTVEVDMTELNSRSFVTVSR